MTATQLRPCPAPCLGDSILEMPRFCDRMFRTYSLPAKKHKYSRVLGCNRSARPVSLLGPCRSVFAAWRFPELVRVCAPTTPESVRSVGNWSVKAHGKPFMRVPIDSTPSGCSESALSTREEDSSAQPQITELLHAA